LAKVGFGSTENERVHHQQTFTRLVRKDFDGLSDDLIAAGRANCQVHQSLIGVKRCRCGPGDAIYPQVVVRIAVG